MKQRQESLQSELTAEQLHEEAQSALHASRIVRLLKRGTIKKEPPPAPPSTSTASHHNGMNSTSTLCSN